LTGELGQFQFVSQLPHLPPVILRVGRDANISKVVARTALLNLGQ